ncbi:MAG: response regulator transcription factor [Candidatus Obscuribacterales bacterium]|nr:response regulator transcription factor [Candidatus Obscuribacterales bacterium]
MRILLAEDDEILSNGISKALRQCGYTVDHVASGADADVALAAAPFDLAILDLGLPQIDGLEVLKRLRSSGKRFPVLIVTARDGLDDRVSGLDLGADDYMTKPFDLPELEARVRALIRRSNYGAETEIIYGPVCLDTVSRSISIAGEAVEFSSRELAVFELLLQRPGRVVSKEQLLEHMYGFEEEVSQNAVEVLIHRLRKKIESYGLSVRTIRGLGYVLENEQ